MRKVKKEEQTVFLSPQAVEQQLIYYANMHALELYRTGKAPVSLTVHLLKAGSRREQLAIEKMSNEAALSKAKVIEIESREESSNLAGEAIEALRTYSGMKDD